VEYNYIISYCVYFLFAREGEKRPAKKMTLTFEPMFAMFFFAFLFISYYFGISREQEIEEFIRQENDKIKVEIKEENGKVLKAVEKLTQLLTKKS
jgi:hypothetical protein